MSDTRTPAQVHNDRIKQNIRDLEAEGGKVLNTFLSPDAHRALNKAIRHGAKTQRAVVEAALIEHARNLPQRATLTTKGSK